MGKARVDVRKPPVQAVFRQHPQEVRGTCCWCGLPCEETTPGRGWLKWWHAACELEYNIIIRPEAARRAVEHRDHGICCDCDEDWSERYLLRSSGVTVTVSDGWSLSPGAEYQADRRAGFYAYSEVLYVSLWHVDHKVPLWKVTHMPDLQRLEYFKLANLITRCHICHARKTKGEAAERAKFDRRAQPDLLENPKSKWGTRKLQGRNTFPPRGSTPMRKK